jgi:hypothetical protein
MPLIYRFNPWRRTISKAPPKPAPEPASDPSDGIDWRPRTLHHFRQHPGTSPADQAPLESPPNNSKFHSTSPAIGALNVLQHNLREYVPPSETGDYPMATKSKKTTTKKTAKRASANGKPATPRKESKSAKVVALLQRASGVTREEVLKVTGWKAVSMQALASNAGVKLKMEKVEGKPIRYRA